MMKQDLNSTNWLQWASGSLLLGKLMQSVWASNPVIEFLGYESWIAPLIRPWMSWESYATQVYPGLSEGAAWVWTLIYALAFLWVVFPQLTKWLIWPGIVLLLLDTGMATAGQYYWWATVLEKTLMWLTPICYLSSRYAKDQGRWMEAARYGIILVFLIHGLYALEVLPRPGYWTEMVSTTTGMSNHMATWFLKTVGILDILAALWLLLNRRVPVMVWYYLIGWGLLTAFGRLSGFITGGTWSDLLINWSYETLIRVPHGLVPLAVFTSLRKD